MVNKNATLGVCNGIQEWFLVRFSAVIVFFYTLYLLYFFISVKNITYEIWHNFFSMLVTKIFTLITLISITFHTWIGMWQIITDYTKYMAIPLQLCIFIILFAYLFYGAMIVWST